MRLLFLTAAACAAFAVSADVNQLRGDAACGERRMALSDFRDRMEGAWIGQSVGVVYGAPVEFKYEDELVPEEKLPRWSPELINGTFSQDDLYVEMTFIRTLERRGLDVTTREAGIDFANSRYRLWAANQRARNNIRSGIAAPASSHPKYHSSTDDIDYQIESDYSGILAPGLPQVAVDFGETFGRIMNDGDGLYAGQFVGAMYAAAYFETDRVKVVQKALRAIPSESHYAQMVRDMLAWHASAPQDWRGTWRKAVDRYGRAASRGKRRISWEAIEGTVNGAMALLGFLYGEGDMDRTMSIAAAGGYDADCNPSTACGVLGTMLGAHALAPRYLTALDRTRKWDYTDYDWDGLLKTCEKLTRAIVIRAGGRVERDAAGEEWLVIPEREPRPSEFHDARHPRPDPTAPRLTAEENARILYLPCEKDGEPSREKFVALSGADTWAGRRGHPARVHSVMDAADDADRIPLRGEWDFVMTTFSRGRRNSHDIPLFLEDEAWKSSRKIVVPGCWEAQGVGEPGMGECWSYRYDCGPKPVRHKAMGEGWYRRQVRIPESWRGKRVWLKVGGVKSCGWFWVNGRQAAHVSNFCSALKYDVTDCVTPGEAAEIAAQVSNVVPSRKGCMSYVHQWGGIFRDVELEATPETLIDEAWVRGDFDLRKAQVKVEVAGGGGQRKDSFSLRATVEGETVEVPLSSSVSTYDLHFALRAFRPWSPEHPNLYTAKVELVENGRAVQTRLERFGVRKLEVRGKEFYLNGKPFFARGFGDDSVYPLTGLPPADRETHLSHLRKARAAGFNFVRLHTHCEIPEYFEAADEAGVLVEAELPYINGDIPVDHFAFDPVADTKELWRNYRRHPSFAVYSGGNEGSFGPALDGYLYRMTKEMDPDRLRVCQDSQMAGFNREGTSDFRGGPVSEWPRGAIDPDRPFLCHEYLNLCVKLDSRLEERFTGAWQPPVTRADRAAWLGKFGLGLDWGDRLQDAQHALQAHWQKHGVEAARADPHCDGFCFWTIVDVVVGQCGSYTSQGLFDPFWNQKRGGLSPQAFAKFNSPICVLADLKPDRRIFVSGERSACDFILSHYGERPLSDAALRWRVVADGRTLVAGEVGLGDQPPGPAHKVGSAEIAWPDVPKPVAVKLVAETEGCANDWDLWLFPRRERRSLSGVAVSASLRPALSALYDGLVPVEAATNCHTAVLAADDPSVSLALERGLHVISIGPVDRTPEEKPSEWTLGQKVDGKALADFSCGSEDVRLGWWTMGRNVGAALKASPLWGDLPHAGVCSPLFFRIIGAGRGLPASRVREEDLVMVGEGGDDCHVYVSSSRRGLGRLTEVNGLDLLLGTPEGTCILDGMIDSTETDVLTVLTWNTEHYGWDDQPREQAELRERIMFDVIRDSGADIVLIQESYGAFERFRKGLPGFDAVLHNPCNSVYSRYPIVDTRILLSDRKYKAGVFDFGLSEVDCGGRRVRVSSLAMNWQPYGAAMTLRIGEFKTAADLLAWESAEQPNGGTPRPQAMSDILRSMRRELSETESVPVIIGGDFNSQSHLDWTAATAVMPEHGGLVVPWGVSTQMAEAGFTDTFRFLNPDPTTAYGSTFPRTGKGGDDRDVRLRYDFIYSRGGALTPIASECCTGRYLQPFRYRGREYPAFPSDHGFVVTRFKWGK